MSWTDHHQTRERTTDEESSIDDALDEWVQQGQTHPQQDDTPGVNANGDATAETRSPTASASASDDPLTMAQCPHCDSREFVSKKLVYEEFHYAESGDLEHHQNTVRAEFEFTCTGCSKRFHELPRNARSYYTEVAVLRQDLRRAIRVQTRAWVESIADIFR